MDSLRHFPKSLGNAGLPRVDPKIKTESRFFKQFFKKEIITYRNIVRLWQNVLYM